MTLSVRVLTWSWLIPMFGLGMSAPGLGPPCWWVLSWLFGCFCPPWTSWGTESMRTSDCGSLWLWEVELAGAGLSLRPTLVMCQLISCLSSSIHSSCHCWGSSLGASTYSPLYTCSSRSRNSPSVDPRSVLRERCARVISLADSLGWA